jgi:SAM-dependent methyltransferase
MNWYRNLRKVYRVLVPGAVRRKVNEFVPHDLIYHKAYFLTDAEGPAVKAAPVFTELVGNEFRPRRVIDVGCGTGALLEAFARAGWECVGLEYAEAALKMCRARGLDVRKFDLEKDAWRGEVACFDVAVSLEVAEHLPEQVADHYVGLLVSLAPVLVFSAATVGQGGTDHVNEQPNEYWVAKFEARGYRHSAEVSQQWRRRLEREGVARFYSDNLMIFRRPEGSETHSDQLPAPVR